MKKTILLYGSLSALIITSFMVVSTIICYGNDNFESGSMALGFAAMFVAFSFVFIGIKNFRDKYNEGIITFQKAFLIGLFITLIASTVYVITWVIEYYNFFSDFMEKYADYMLKAAKDAGETASEMEKKTQEMTTYKELYKNPLFVVLLTYMEILPMGLLITLISALVLKKKAANQSTTNN